MSAPQPADSVMFPELDDEQLAIVFALGERREVDEGEILFSPADDHYDWIVILSGQVDVLGSNGEYDTGDAPPSSSEAARRAAPSPAACPVESSTERAQLSRQ